MSPVVIGIVLFELALTIILGLIFILFHSRTPWYRTPIGWQLMITFVASVGESFILFLLGLGIVVPGPIFVIGYGVINIVMIRWLVLLWRARRSTKKIDNTETTQNFS